ncbi:MAG: hypothetical protein S4CHLAM20_04160 [Chlamydiia bacterium]|nr:hypothetical protein [Chlamydiia bacterium]
MPAIGGDIIEITYNHPTLGSGSFFPKSEEDGTIDPGGFRTADEDNGVTGSGDAIYKKNRKRWSVEITSRWDANKANDLERLNLLSNSSIESTLTFELANGTVWKGQGMPVGDVQGSSNEATMSVKFAGGGFLEKIFKPTA